MPKIVVLGGGESGCGAAVLARVKGFDVFLSDMGVIAPKYKALLAEWNVPYEEGQHTAGRILDADRVVKSPGIPDKAPMMKAVRERGIPVVSEIEFAAPYTSARTICVTGSNGKTTTTTLTYEILRRAGANVALGGNIGRSFALSVATERRDWYVIELSSFQLDRVLRFPGRHRGADEHYARSFGPVRVPAAELCRQQIPHPAQPASAGLLYLLRRRSADARESAEASALHADAPVQRPARRLRRRVARRDDTGRGCRPPAGNSGFRASDQRDA